MLLSPCPQQRLVQRKDFPAVVQERAGDQIERLVEAVFHHGHRQERQQIGMNIDIVDADTGAHLLFSEKQVIALQILQFAFHVCPVTSQKVFDALRGVAVLVPS